jgi:hypothetical protein
MSCVSVADRSIGQTCVEERKPFYFFHMPKTGGRTIERHIAGQFGPRRVFRPAKSKTLYTDCFTRKKYIISKHARDAHIVGHFASWSLLVGREQKYYKACFWRHPADWLLSFYNYRLHRNRERINRAFDFVSFYRSMLRNPMTEHFLLYCGDVPGCVYFFMSDRKKFEVACELAQRFDCFTDIANVDNFIDVIGFEDRQRPADRNRIPLHQKALGSLDETTRVEIERTNLVDYYLYRIAKGGDRARIIDEGQRVLRPYFNPRDILRLIAVPYYRFKTWALPFIGFPLQVPTIQSHVAEGK